MRFESDALDLDLAHGAIVRLPDTFGLRVAVREGAIWLTLDGDLRDIVLEPGDAFVSDSHRRGILYALKPARVGLSNPAQRSKRSAVSSRATLSKSAPAAGLASAAV